MGELEELGELFVLFAFRPALSRILGRRTNDERRKIVVLRPSPSVSPSIVSRPSSIVYTPMSLSAPAAFTVAAGAESWLLRCRAAPLDEVVNVGGPGFPGESPFGAIGCQDHGRDVAVAGPDPSLAGGKERVCRVGLPFGAA